MRKKQRGFSSIYNDIFRPKVSAEYHEMMLKMKSESAKAEKMKERNKFRSKADKTVEVFQ